MYSIFLSKRSKKDLKKLAKIYQIKVAQILDALENNPFLGEKMQGGFKGSYRIKIQPLRIIYTPDIKRKIIWIEALGHRGDIYK